MFKDLRRALADHVSSANTCILIIAPYIKRSALDGLIAGCVEDVELTIVTVWDLADLAAGVSDLKVWEAICERPNAKLLLCPSLHAKYYRADERVMIGSANITASALGVSSSPNLEILVELSQDDPGLLGFEDEVFSKCINVTEELYNEFSVHLSRLPLEEVDKPTPDLCKDLLKAHHAWMPKTRYPENLYPCYKGEIDGMTTAAKLTCFDDLLALKIPESLNEHQFNYCVRRRLEDHPVFVELLEFGRSSRRFGEVRDMLSRMGAKNGSSAWQTWMRWLEKFTPERFEFWEASYSEIFRTIE